MMNRRPLLRALLTLPFAGLFYGLASPKEEETEAPRLAGPSEADLRSCLETTREEPESEYRTYYANIGQGVLPNEAAGDLASLLKNDRRVDFSGGLKVALYSRERGPSGQRLRWRGETEQFVLGTPGFVEPSVSKLTARLNYILDVRRKQAGESASFDDLGCIEVTVLVRRSA